jgi:hypothetical protein
VGAGRGDVVDVDAEEPRGVRVEHKRGLLIVTGKYRAPVSGPERGLS